MAARMTHHNHPQQGVKLKMVSVVSDLLGSVAQTFKHERVRLCFIAEFGT